jgi:hypothetical protein
MSTLFMSVVTYATRYLPSGENTGDSPEKDFSDMFLTFLPPFADRILILSSSLPTELKTI